MTGLKNATPQEVEKAYNYTNRMIDQLEQYPWSNATPRKDSKKHAEHLDQLRTLANYLYHIHHQEESNG